MNMPFVSVIIPVQNDLERLQTCLQALERQSYPQDHYEILVVDNASDAPVALSECPHARVFFEGRRGSYAARNTGIAHARGEIFAFTDSDCVPADDWLEQGVAALRGVEPCGCVGGNIEFFFRDPAHPTAVELYDSVMHLDQEAFIRRKQFSVTANLFTFRQVVETVGAFDSSLESNGDKDWGQRVASHGYRLAYAERAVVKHPARQTFAELRRKVTRVVKGAADLSQARAAAGTPALRGPRWSLPVLKIFKLRKQYPMSLPVYAGIWGIWLAMKWLKLHELLRARWNAMFRNVAKERQER